MALKIFFYPEFSKYFSTVFFFLVDESMSAKELNFHFPNTNPLANILITDLEMKFGPDVDPEEIKALHWQAFEEAIYTHFEGFGVPSLSITISPTRSSDSQRQTREIFQWLVCSITESGLLTRLFNDNKLEVIYKRHSRAPPLPYQDSSSRNNWITLGEVLKLPGERLVEGKRIVVLGTLEKLRLIFCETIDEGQRFLSDLLARTAC